MNTKTNTDLERASDGAAFAALIFFILFFVAIVGFGWWRNIIPMLEFIPAPFGSIVAAIAALFCAIFAVILGKYAAAERVRIYADADRLTSQKQFAWWVKVWPFLVLLLFLSALGTARTIFSVTQESNVLRDEVSATAQKIRALDRAIDSTFNELPEYVEYLKVNATYREMQRQAQLSLNQFVEEMARVERAGERELAAQHARVEVLWRNFANEVQNPANCGFGPVALRHFQELQKTLPGLERLSSGAGCDRARDQKVLDEYRVQVDALKSEVYNLEKISCDFSVQATLYWSELRASWSEIPPLPAANLNCGEVPQVMAGLQSSVEPMIEGIGPPEEQVPVTLVQYVNDAKRELASQLVELEKAQREANTMSTDAKLSVLRDSWEAYRKVYADGRNVSANVSFNLPSDIKREEVENIQSLANVLRILVTRWTNFMTYVTLFSAILLDIILIAFFYRHLSARLRTTPVGPYENYALSNSPFDIR